MQLLNQKNFPKEECFLFLRKFSEPVIGEVLGFTPSSCFGPARWKVRVECPNQAGAILNLSLTPTEVLGWE